MTKAQMAATVSLIQMLAAGCANSDGTPIASGQARFYQPGTLTPVTVYADAAGATAVTPPLVLTAGGTGIAYTQQPTRMIVKDSTATNTLIDANVNTTRAESDYITSAAVNGGTETRLQTWIDAFSTSFGGSAGLWLFKLASNATERTLKSIVADFTISVKNFGAVGDGVADDTTKIQATIDYVAGVGGGTVLIPVGTYLISAPLSIAGSGIAIVGQSQTASIIKNNAGTTKAFVVASGNSILWKTFTVNHATSSTAVGIDTGTSTGNIFDSVTVTGHASGISGGTSTPMTVRDCFLSTSTASLTAALAIATNGIAIVYGGAFFSTAGIGISVGSGGILSIYSSAFNVSAGIVAIDVAGTASLYAYGVRNEGASLGLRTAATSSIVFQYACNWGTTGGGVTDARTGAPISYVFATDGNFTPLPMRTDAVRVEASGAAVVTINAITPTGFGRRWSLICTRTTASAVTFTFNAQYVLSAAVAPANGNRVNLLLEYNPVDDKVYEIGRAATAN